MLRIGDFARLSQVSVKALRFYGEIGLLKPSFVDQQTGYRYYAPSLTTRLNQILAFKELGFSLAEIAALLQRNLAEDELRTVLERQRNSLSQRIAQEQAQLAQVDAWLQQLSGSAAAGQPFVALKQTAPQLVASLRSTLSSYDDTEELFAELQHHLGRSQRHGVRAAIWHACANRGEPIDCEALIYLHHRVPDTRRIQVYELPATAAAWVIHSDGYTDGETTIENAYRAARRWIKTQGFVHNGPNREIYWPAAHAAESVTEIQFPVLLATQRAATH